MGWRVKQDPKNGTPVVELDAIHANVAGRYLGGLVFYFTLFGVSEAPISYRPDGLGETDARQLRSVAEASVLAAQAERGVTVPRAPAVRLEPVGR